VALAILGVVMTVGARMVWIVLAVVLAASEHAWPRAAIPCCSPLGAVLGPGGASTPPAVMTTISARERFVSTYRTTTRKSPMAHERRYETTGRGRLRGDDLAGLFGRAVDGDQAGWNALIDEFGGVVWGTARAHRLSGADAADVFQTTWMRLVENLDGIRDPARLGGWLATTARHESLNVIRRTVRVIPRSDDFPDVPSDAPHPDERLITEQNGIALQIALERLGPRDRALLRLLAAEPTPSYAEISAVLGIAIGSVGPMRGRALTRLRREAARVGLIAQGCSCSSAAATTTDRSSSAATSRSARGARQLPLEDHCLPRTPPVEH
jgi:RNA polymerase sigma factor (sigma-70 family)